MLLGMLLIQAVTQLPLNLTCMGAGTANKPDFARAWASDGTSASYLGKRQQGFDDQVDVRLFGGDDRIRMPRTMLPPIRGGEAGWFKLKNVVATERTITAKAAVSFVNNPNIHIDRITGTISISGKSGDYTGQCQVIEADAQPKF